MNSEELAAQLTEAREELEELLTEQRRIGGEMAQARLEDAEARVNAPGGIRGAIASAVSRVRGVQDRAEQLPHEIWSAQLHVLALERDYQQALYDELAEPEARTYEEFKRLDDELPKLQRRRQDALDHSLTAGRDRRAAGNRVQELGEQLEALKKAGPLGPAGTEAKPSRHALP